MDSFKKVDTDTWYITNRKENNPMSVEQNLEQILSARYGKDVRQSIHDAIYDINEVAKDAEYHASTAPTSAQAYANAALAAEQAAQQAKQDAEAAAEQAMSGTPTGYDQVVAEVRSLKTNENVVLAEAGTFAGRVLLDKMYGMSVQNGTPTPSVPVAIKSAKANFDNRGKNLNNYPYKTDSSSGGGVYYTAKSDGSVDIYTDGASTVEHVYVLHSRYEVDANPCILKNGSYKATLIVSDPNANVKAMLYRTDLNNTGERYFTLNNGDTKTLTLNGDYYSSNEVRLQVVFDIPAGTNIPNTINAKILITVADADQTFEPYQGQSITTDLTLRAIEVKSSADYNLVKDGKYYIADTLEKIDGGYQIRRRIKVITLDGTESWSKAVSDKHYYIPLLQRGIPASLYINDTSCFSEYFVRNNNLLLGWGNAYISYSNINLCNYDDSMSSVANLKTWLSENTPNMWYALETPTIESISNADAKKLLSLKSYDKATYVAQTENTEGIMVLEYGTTNFATKALSGYVEAEQNSIRLSDLES